MLVLGAGLGSALYILGRMRHRFPVTLVDLDPTVIAWGQELLSPDLKAQSTWIQADAREFPIIHELRYDVLVIDLFQDRIVPAFVTSPEFLASCWSLLNGPDSCLVLNYIINNESTWEQALSAIRSVYRVEKILSLGINQVVIARLKA